MKCSALMAVMLADLSRLGLTAADAGSIMNRMILERILGELHASLSHSDSHRILAFQLACTASQLQDFAHA